MTDDNQTTKPQEPPSGMGTDNFPPWWEHFLKVARSIPARGAIHMSSQTTPSLNMANVNQHETWRLTPGLRWKAAHPSSADQKVLEQKWVSVTTGKEKWFPVPMEFENG